MNIIRWLLGGAKPDSRGDITTALKAAEATRDHARRKRDNAMDRLAAIAGIEIERDLTGVADAYVPPEGGKR